MTKKLMPVSDDVHLNPEVNSRAGDNSIALIIDGTSLVYILETELDDQVNTCNLPTLLLYLPLKMLR